MSKLQEIFNRMLESKKEQREIKKMYRDALSTSKVYQDVLEELKVLKDRKKKIKDNFRSEFDKLDTLKTDIESDKMLISDVAINQLVKGEMVEITDQYENKYEPIFSVRFKKR